MFGESESHETMKCSNKSTTFQISGNWPVNPSIGPGILQFLDFLESSSVW